MTHYFLKNNTQEWLFPHMFTAKEIFNLLLIQCLSSCWCVGIKNHNTCGMNPVITFSTSTTDPIVVYRVVLSCRVEVDKADLTLLGLGFDRCGRRIGSVERGWVSKGFLGSGVWGESANCYLLWDMACCLQWTEILGMYSSVPFPWAMWGWSEP